MVKKIVDLGWFSHTTPETREWARKHFRLGGTPCTPHFNVSPEFYRAAFDPHETINPPDFKTSYGKLRR